MPIHYYVDHARQRITVIWEAPVTLAHILATFERQAAEGTWSYVTLADMRALMSAQDISQEIIELIQRLSQIHGRRGAVAALIAPSVISAAEKYAVASARAGNQHTQVFWDRGEAERWLDHQSVPEPPAP